MSQNQNPVFKEMRFGSIQIEKRSSDEAPESRIITGYAAKYDTWSDPIFEIFIETIARGAFDSCDFSDCIATFNHSIDNIMARVSSGTLTIELDKIGLRFSFEAPNTTMGNDMLEMVRRGDISQCSFIFVIEEEKWTQADGDKIAKRELLKISKMYDVSMVTYPAYPDTEVSNARQAIERRCRDVAEQTGSDSDMLDMQFAYYKYKN